MGTGIISGGRNPEALLARLRESLVELEPTESESGISGKLLMVTGVLDVVEGLSVPDEVDAREGEEDDLEEWASCHVGRFKWSALSLDASFAAEFLAALSFPPSLAFRRGSTSLKRDKDVLVKTQCNQQKYLLNCSDTKVEPTTKTMQARCHLKLFDLPWGFFFQCMREELWKPKHVTKAGGLEV